MINNPECLYANGFDGGTAYSFLKNKDLGIEHSIVDTNKVRYKPINKIRPKPLISIDSRLDNNNNNNIDVKKNESDYGFGYKELGIYTIGSGIKGIFSIGMVISAFADNIHSIDLSDNDRMIWGGISVLGYVLGSMVIKLADDKHNIRAYSNLEKNILDKKSNYKTSCNTKFKSS